VTTTIAQPETHTLDVRGATLTYDVRRNDESADPILLLIGSPMGASGFATLAGHFADRTVVTYDPRGVERSIKSDPESPVTPDIQADDVHRVIEAIGGGSVDLFGSSGGAVTALALVAKHPDDVRTLVAHEPPLASLLPDREHALAACRAIHETYQGSGWGAGMAHFIAVVMHRGPFTADVVNQPPPDPAMNHTATPTITAPIAAQRRCRLTAHASAARHAVCMPTPAANTSGIMGTRNTVSK